MIIYIRSVLRFPVIRKDNVPQVQAQTARSRVDFTSREGHLSSVPVLVRYTIYYLALAGIVIVIAPLIQVSVAVAPRGSFYPFS